MAVECFGVRGREPATGQDAVNMNNCSDESTKLASCASVAILLLLRLITACNHRIQLATQFSFGGD